MTSQGTAPDPLVGGLSRSGVVDLDAPESPAASKRSVSGRVRLFGRLAARAGGAVRVRGGVGMQVAPVRGADPGRRHRRGGVHGGRSRRTTSTWSSTSTRRHQSSFVAHLTDEWGALEVTSSGSTGSTRRLLWVEGSVPASVGPDPGLPDGSAFQRALQSKPPQVVAPAGSWRLAVVGSSDDREVSCVQCRYRACRH